MVLSGLALGTALGFVLQRGRFCVTGAFRDVWLTRKTRWMTAFLLAIAVQAVGIVALQSAGVLNLTTQPLALLGVTAGSLLFGLGIVLAGGCATGTYYRAGEGLVGSWIALGMYALFAAGMKYGILAPLNDSVRSVTVPATTIHDSLGVSPWVLVIPFAALVGWLVHRQLAASRGRKVATLPPRYTGIRHLLFEKTWSPFLSAVIIGLIGIVAFPLSYATGRQSGLGITTPSADWVAWFTSGGSESLGWGPMLVLGILIGSFVAAKASGEFRVRVPDARTVLHSVGGGALMGIGAAWAGGCTIGNSFVQTSQLSYQGWIAFAFTFLGVGLGTKLIHRPRRSTTGVPTPTSSTAPVPAA